jgi:cation:H+ antiporter
VQNYEKFIIFAFRNYYIFMTLTILILILGMGLIVAGATYFTDGASLLAKRFGIPEFVIGLTIVAIGTSLPELAVSVLSAMRGSYEIAIGNVVGSNTFNILIILAISAIIKPLPVTKNMVRQDIPFMILACLACVAVAGDVMLGDGTEGIIGRGEGLLLLGFFVIFMVYMVLSGREGGKGANISEKRVRVAARRKNPWVVVLMIVGGCASLVVGADMFLDSAVIIAEAAGMSEAVIGVTIVAAGTSIPELAASVAAALKGNTGIAMGNVVGSNIFNIFLILGVSATVHPLQTGGIVMGDLWVMTGAAIFVGLCAMTFRKNYVDRPEGAVMLLAYIGYVWWLLAR